MKGAYRNYEPEAFAAFVMAYAGFKSKAVIESIHGWPMYLLSQ